MPGKSSILAGSMAVVGLPALGNIPSYGSGSLSSYWNTLISATVEDAAPTHVVLTFPQAKTFSASDFTIAGFTVLSGSWAGSVYTLVLSTSVVYGNSLTVVWKGTNSHAVTNNVLWTPQYLGTKLLGWFREIDEAAGQQPNKKTGASDYLTVVSGSGLNKVYTLPNTTPYKNADTDYCWWKTDGSLSTTDGNRLIAYDFARTIIKYDSTTPYTLRETIILTAGATLTTTEMNLLRIYAKLSPWWDGTWSDYGEIKENRAFEYDPWTPEAVAGVATVTTTAISTILNISASGGGNVTADGGTTVTARGVCWSLSANPTISDSHTTNGSGTGVFTSSLTGLTAGTAYHVRAYATNSVDTAYGSDVQFTTLSYTLYDTFTDTTGVRLNAHAMDIGGVGWIEESGVWTISSGKAAEATQAGVQYRVVRDAGISDTPGVSLDIPVGASTVQEASGLTFRYQDATHKWQVFYENDAIGGYLVLLLDGTQKGLVMAVDLGGAGIYHTTVTLKVVLSGTSITIYWNDVLKIGVTDATYQTATIFGIAKYRAFTYTDMLVDNFKLI
jgi:hypothetical protein